MHCADSRHSANQKIDAFSVDKPADADYSNYESQVSQQSCSAKLRGLLLFVIPGDPLGSGMKLEATTAFGMT